MRSAKIQNLPFSSVEEGAVIKQTILRHLIVLCCVTAVCNELVARDALSSLHTCVFTVHLGSLTIYADVGYSLCHSLYMNAVLLHHATFIHHL